MTEVVKFTVESRETVGTGAARAHRRAGMLPGIIYGGKDAGQKIVLSLKEFNREYQKGSFHTKLVELVHGGKAITALPKAIQLHPVTDIPEHVDFLRVGKDTTVRIFINIKVINEDKSIGIKKGGIVNIVHRAIEFACHPSNIPHNIEIDVGGLDIGQNVHINDILLPKGVTPVDQSNFTIVSVMGRAAEEEKPAEVTAAATTDAAAPGATTAAPGAAAATPAAADKAAAKPAEKKK